MECPHTKLTAAAKLPVNAVHAFVEKPCEALAVSLMSGGALWNTFMLVGKLRAFFKMLRQATPQLCTGFAPLLRAIGRPTEPAIATALYDALPSIDLSRDVLALQPDRLAVIEAPAMGWTDLGRAERVLALRGQVGLASSPSADQLTPA